MDNTKNNITNKKEYITSAEAVDFFNRMQEWPELYNKAPEDGCFARAHLIGLKAEDRGLEPKKVWAFKTDRPELIYLRAKMNTKYRELASFEKDVFEYSFHVAISLPVKTSNGKIESLIFDPVLFDGPATKQQWAKEINAHEPSLITRGIKEPLTKNKDDYFLPDEPAPEDCVSEAKNYLHNESKSELYDIERIRSNWLNFYNYVEKENKNLPEKAMSIKDAKALFKQIQENPDYACNNPTEGCYARAYLITENAKVDGYNPKKIWYNAEENAPEFTVSFKAKKAETDGYVEIKQNLAFHVAALLPVKDSKGKIHQLVFDPTLFEGPVSKEQWSARFGSKKPIITELNQAPSQNANSYSANGFEPHDKYMHAQTLLCFSNINKYEDIERKKSAWMLIQQRKSTKSSYKMRLKNILSLKRKERL